MFLTCLQAVSEGLWLQNGLEKFFIWNKFGMLVFDYHTVKKYKIKNIIRKERF